MIRVAICDDEASMREQLRLYCTKLAKELDTCVETLEFSTATALIESSLAQVDILLLDIKMGEVDGLTAAEHIRKIAPDLCIIFITSMVQYAIFGYQVRAFSFLPKPVGYPKFRQELLAAIHQLEQRSGHYLMVPGVKKGTQVKLDLNQVLYFEVCNHAISIHTESGCIEYRGQLKTLQAQLGDQSGFFRCHTSYLVNYRYIQRIDLTSLTLTNAQQIPISKQKRKEFLTALTDYAGRQML